MMDIRKIFEYALQREYEGKRFFLEHADRFSHASAVDIFRKLALEEQKHIDFIQKQINLIDGDKSTDLVLDLLLEQEGFFSLRAMSEIIEQTVSESMVPDLPVLRMAYLIERDFAEFYEKAANNTSGEVRSVLETLAYWERRHEVLFKDLHDRAFELYSGMPWGG
jgi:rubrerythrin